MHRSRRTGVAVAAGVLLACLASAPARAEIRTICTIVADAATGETLVRDGACDTRATPASTFKIPIALMGFDAGILKDAHTPEWPFRQGYPDWQKTWRSATDPQKWLKDSVVWYSQQVTLKLGRERFAGYVRAFDYGNGDVSGDRGKDNGLTHAWLNTSLEISPVEQIAFLGKLVRSELPVSRHALTMTAALTDYGPQRGGWRVHGKTGSGLAKARWGWFVGWATKDGRTVLFARLTRSDTRPPKPIGPTTRDAVMRDLFSKPGRL